MRRIAAGLPNPPAKTCRPFLIATTGTVDSPAAMVFRHAPADFDASKGSASSGFAGIADDCE
jgi:hypothetical protein